jgi:Txe/YoeB family toxin of Txe-Axe toxin-antitoxin module
VAQGVDPEFKSQNCKKKKKRKLQVLNETKTNNFAILQNFHILMKSVAKNLYS